MTTPAEVIARVAASMARQQAEEAERAARARAYNGPERRRGGRRATDEQPTPAEPPAPGAAAPP